MDDRHDPHRLPGTIVPHLELVADLHDPPPEFGDEPRRMLFDDGHLWVTNTGDGTVSVPEAPIPE